MNELINHIYPSEAWSQKQNIITMIRILIVEDDEFDNLLLLNRLKKSGLEFEHKTTDNYDKFIQLLKSFRPSIVLSDFNLGSFTGFDTIRAVKEFDANLPIIIITGRVNEETSVQCLKDGAWHYIIKDNMAMVPRAIQNALEYVEEQKQKLQAWHKLNQQNEELVALNKELSLAKEKAEESARLKTRFIKNISHEIRTPLNGIMGFISLLNSEEVFSEKYRMYFDLIQKNGADLLNVMTNIMNISLIESNQVHISLQPVILSQLLANLTYEYDPLLHAKGVQLTVKTGNIGREPLLLDQKLIWEIIKQLLDNAIKFTPEGQIEIVVEKDNSNLVIHVKDTGIGIPQDKFDVIFNRFVTHAHEPESIYRGNGLGLAVVDGFVKKLGGCITIDSELSKGSVFTVTLPIG